AHTFCVAPAPSRPTGGRERAGVRWAPCLFRCIAGSWVASMCICICTRVGTINQYTRVPSARIFLVARRGPNPSCGDDESDACWRLLDPAPLHLWGAACVRHPGRLRL